MIVKSEYKVPGGKMIKVEVRIEGEAIKWVRITGDFFIYPEETIDRLEGALVDQPITADFIKLISDLFSEMNAEIAGATNIDFAVALKRALILS